MAARSTRLVLAALTIVLVLGSSAASLGSLLERDQAVPQGTCSVKHALDDDAPGAKDRPAGDRPQRYQTDDYDCAGAVFTPDKVEFARFPQPADLPLHTVLDAKQGLTTVLSPGVAVTGQGAPYVPPFTHFVILYKENHVFDDYLGDCQTFNSSCDGVNQTTNHVAQVPYLHQLARTYALFDEYSTGTQPPSGPNHWWLFSAQSSTTNQQQPYPPSGTNFDRLLNHTANGTTLLVNGDIYWITTTNSGVVYNGSLGRADWLPVSRPGTGIPEELNYNNYTLYKQNDDDTLIRSSFEDFVNKSGLPAYTYIELFNDHPGTYQDIPKNDAVTNDLVHFISDDPRYHDNTVIVVTEDDTQNGANGPDHVSNTYRVPLIVVASEKHEKRNYISHVAYNTTNVIALLERVMDNVAPGIVDPHGNIGASTFPMRSTDQSALGDPLTDIWLNSTTPPRLTASASAQPTSGNVPLTVNFTGNATGGVPPFRWSWAFGDGASSTTQSPTHTYTAACTCVATLTVTDNASQTSTANVTITAASSGSPLNASASANPTSGQVPLNVQFTGGASGGTTPYNWTWSFGDGSAASYQQSPAHTYNAPASYQANLTVRDASGNTSTSSVAITADPSGGTSPEPQPTASPTNGTAPLSVQFNVSTVGGIPPYTYAWDFGDGATGTGQTPSHTYTGTGTYKAIVTATDSGGATGTGNVTITVSAAPCGGGPANDCFANAIGLTSPAYQTPSTTGATLETGEPQPCGSIGATIWYSWTPQASGTATVTTVNSTTNYDTVLAAYTGSALSSLTNVACNDDYGTGTHSQITFACTPGTTYRIQLGGYAGATGKAGLKLSGCESTTTTVPGAPTGLTATAVNATEIDLSWTAPASDGGAAITSYKIYRGTTSGGETLYYTTSTNGTTFKNTANVNASTTYYYEVSAVNSVGEGALSNEASATTPAQGGGTAKTFFSDDMEIGTNGWTVVKNGGTGTSTWQRVTTQANSPTHSWTCGGGTSYAANSNCDLISPTIDLSTASAAHVTWFHKIGGESGYDMGSVYVSKDNGSTWTLIVGSLHDITAWTNATYDLSKYSGVLGSAQVKVKYHFVSDSTVQNNAWFVDDVKVWGTG